MKQEKKKQNYIVSRCILSVLLIAVIGAIVYTAVAMPDAPLIVETSQQESSQPKEQSTVQESSKEESSKTESSVPESSIEESSKEVSDNSSSDEPSETSENSKAETETVKINLNQKPTSNSAGMKKYIESYGFGFDTLYCSQLIVVDTQGSNAQIYCFQKSSDGYWFNIVKEGEPLTDKAFVSKDGISYNINTENQCTPLGMYALDEVFYTGEKPQTDYNNLLKITNTLYWVTDPNSKFYNQAAVESQKDWNSAIKFSDNADAYEYGVVVGYNTGTVDKTKGAGIFMQCGTEPTNGSIAMPTETMKTIVEWLTSSTSAFVLIL